MTINKMKTATFEEANYEEWQEIALKSMRGQPFDKLITKTPEGIDLQPLYIAQEELNDAIPTIREAKTSTGWIIAQQQYASDGKTFVAELTISIGRGNEAIFYDGNSPLIWDDESLSTLAKLLTSYPVFLSNINENDPILAIFNLVPVEERSKVQGVVSLLSSSLPEGFINVRSIIADLRDVHYGGADAVTELAVALAEAAELAANYETFAEFSEQFSIRFAVDTHFFMEIAKIRAYRVLWKALGRAFGEDAKHIPLLAETSLRTYSKLDPYVNLLRAGNETLSAVLGGADVITVHPHNVLTGITPASIRIARNVQIVIKEEALLDKVIDPSGGSYFIETLTRELVEKAWQLFLEIDGQGGYKAFVESGALDKRLKTCQEMRLKDVANGKTALIGTNVYADIEAVLSGETDGFIVEGRLAEPFEVLREHFLIRQPKTVLCTFGPLKDFKPRADFVSGFLATGGIQADKSPEFTTAAEALEWLANEKPDYAIVCGTTVKTEEVMSELLAGMPKGIKVDIAGKFDSEQSSEWLTAGLNGFIYSGLDRIEKLLEIKNGWKEVDAR